MLLNAISTPQLPSFFCGANNSNKVSGQGYKSSKVTFTCHLGVSSQDSILVRILQQDSIDMSH